MTTKTLKKTRPSKSPGITLKWAHQIAFSKVGYLFNSDPEAGVYPGWVHGFEAIFKANKDFRLGLVQGLNDNHPSVFDGMEMLGKMMGRFLRDRPQIMEQLALTVKDGKARMKKRRD